MNLKKIDPNVVLLHVGTNNIKKGIMAEEIMGEMMDLVSTIQSTVPEAKVIISGILRRNDVTERRLNKINSELDWLCE